MIRRILPYCWWSILLFGIIAACGMIADDREPLRVRLATWPGYAPLYVVEEQKLAAPTNIQISTSELAQDNYRAFAERRVDVLATTLQSAILFQDQSTPTVMILLTDYSAGADGIIARPGIDDLADLQGRTVGVESGSVSHFVLLRALELAGVPPETIEIVNIGVPEAINAIESDQVDAAVVWEPVLSKYPEPPLFTSAEIPEEIVDVLVVHPETLAERRDDLVNLLRGWEQALQRLDQGNSETLAIMATGLNVAPDDLQQQLNTIRLIGLEQNAALLESDSSNSLQPTFEHITSFLDQTGQLQNGPPAFSSLIDGSIINEALHQESE
jgi:NitT/TauT family transport system substrate-binding protein